MSDHLSSPRALADPASDICDLYAFPSPEHPGRLTLVLTVFPRAGQAALFSDAVLCRFRLRRASIAATGPQTRFAVAPEDEEIRIDCAFAEPDGSPDDTSSSQHGTCTLPSGEIVPVTVKDRRGSSRDGVRVFAGLVSDPFIFQIESIVETLTTGQMAFGKFSKNTMEGANVLGLVVEIDCARWLGGEPLVAVVGETLAVGKQPVRLERVGRPEIKNIGMQWNGNDTLNRDIDLRDLYNQEDAFHLGEQYRGAYRARLGANLRFYDGLDGKVDWPLDDTGEHPLVDLVLEDYLVVDTSKPFAEDSWFEIERAMIEGRPHSTSGGRTLNDDFLDTYYTLFINAGDGPRIRDGVDQATVPATNVFPYLAPPNPPAPATEDREEVADR